MKTLFLGVNLFFAKGAQLFFWRNFLLFSKTIFDETITVSVTKLTGRCKIHVLGNLIELMYLYSVNITCSLAVFDKTYFSAEFFFTFLTNFYFFYVFDKTFAFLPKLFFYVFGETSIGELHLTKLH